MRKSFIWFLFSALLPSALFVSGCASTQTEQKADNSSLTRNEQIQVVDNEKAELMKQADNTESVDDRVNLGKDVAIQDEEVYKLKSGKKSAEVTPEEKDKADGFKRTKDRTIVYGPVGAVLHFTEWILVKLYIIHES